MRLLIANGHRYSCALMASTLETRFEISIVNDAPEVMTSFLDAEAQEAPYDAILIDTNLPHNEGNHILIKIRKYEAKKGPSLKKSIIALTSGGGDKKDIDACIALGFDYYFVKDTDPARILDKVRLKIEKTKLALV